ncbi:MAG TPA: helix-turn-helix transcriptional regulator [Mycobacterium sp.]|jgi:transcriptional regulator with XRE-family HTH domain
MSESLPGSVPEWDLADRMRKSLRVAGLPGRDMAAYLGVEHSTVSRWLNGRVDPSTRTLRLWALRTGVPYEWLRDGWAPRGSNPQPTDYEDAGSARIIPFRRAA